MPTCSICNDTFEGYGHNPEPVRKYEERCCDACNDLVVIPARLQSMGMNVAQAHSVALQIRASLNEHRKRNKGTHEVTP